MNNESFIESSTKIFYSIKEISGDLQVFWSRYLSFYFSSSAQSNIQQLEIEAASVPLKDPEEAIAFFKTLTDEEKCWIVASFKLIANHAEKTNNWIGHHNVKMLIEELAPLSDSNRIDLTYAKLRSDFAAFENRKTFVVSGSIALITIEYLIRCLLLIVSNIFSIDGGAAAVVSLCTLIPTLGYTAWRSRKDRKFNEQLINKNIQLEWLKIKNTYSTLQYTIVGFFAISGAIIFGLLISKNQMDFLSVLLILSVLIIYFISILNLFPIGRLSEESLIKQIHGFKEESKMDFDQNDETIVLLETDLNSSTGRLEAYVLESALFGALAFSGFLQIIATDLITFNDLEEFASTCFQFGHGFVNANWDEYNQSTIMLNTKVSLFCLVSIETLTCSILFLAVIASRLRFSNVADKVRIALNLAKAYNEKEELLLENQIDLERSGIRLTAITEKITAHLKDAKRHMGGVDPIVAYMVYFRNAGLLIFLTVLVSSSLFISSTLSWTYITIGLCTIIYFNIKSLGASLQFLELKSRILYARHSWSALILTLGVGISGYCLRVFLKLDGTDFLIAVSYLMGGAFCFIWIAFLPHPDKSFGEIDSARSQSYRWRLIKTIFGMSVVASSMGFAFMVLDWKGAGIMLYVGVSSLTVMIYFLTYYLVRPKWMSFILAFAIDISLFSILFWILGYEGARQMNFLALITLPLVYMVYFFRRNAIHYLVLRISLLCTIFVLLLLFVVNPPVIDRIRLAYNHKTTAIDFAHDYNVEPITPTNEKFDKTIFQNNVNKSNSYLHTYGKQFGKTVLHRQHLTYFDHVAVDILNDQRTSEKKDTVLLNIAVQSAEQWNKINAMLGYDKAFGVDMQFEALMSLGKKEEAKEFLLRIIKIGKDEDAIKTAREHLETLN